MEKLQHAELNKKKWDARAGTYDEKRFDYFRWMQKRLVSLIDLKEGQRLLDMGCGTGWAIKYAAGLVNGNGEFYGVDLSPKMIEKATTNAAGLKNIHFVQANTEALPFEDNFFDTIICSNSFHHYFNPKKVLSEVRRVLKPGGRIYILDVTSDGLIARSINRRAQKKESEHVKFYNSKEFDTFFIGAKLHHIASQPLWKFDPSRIMKAHIGEKIAE